MAWNQNIPQPTDQLAASQADILNNFQALQTLIDVNHVDFASGDQGKHKFVTFPVQAPAPAFAAGEEGLYNFLYATTVKNELFVHKQTGATTVDIPMTASILSTNSAPAANNGGWTYLPSGILLKFGSSTGVNGTVTVTPASGGTIPGFTQMLTVLVCPFSTTAGDQNFAVRLINIISNTQFTVFVSSRTSTGAATGGFQFLAIGY